ncbi:type II toxin-antitoxin system VapC family toxin [bacterium]|nr:type II toxin-antitoxin system VapC family toxin [bacterium]MBU1599251.1 type II toxin-antitoxin system VapC family toxin [bacterium]MBU2461547.1 type II toxin-antitoxin system VapC family toxin [bacterium]
MYRSLLIDSDILIDHLRKEKKALDFLDTEIEKGSLLFLSVISRTEIYAGMRKEEEEVVYSLFEIIRPVNIDATIADKAGKYLRKFSKSHALNIGDAIIAATASEMELNLATKNLKHYPMKDISVLRPY